MKQLRRFPIATISAKGARSIEHGRPWVFDAEVRTISPAPLDGRPVENGDLVDVADEKGTYLGTGLVSLQSKIRIRLISRNANDQFDRAFWERKIRWAWEYRKAVMGRAGMAGHEDDTDCCRLIFSEADSFGGLIVDRYDDVLVAECLTVGMERLRPTLYPLMLKVLQEDGQDVRAIYERNDASTRQKEGLPLYKGFYDPASNATLTEVEMAHAGIEPRRIVSENGVRYDIDFENSQKTGFFLDQKYNRRAVARLAQGRRVLDCFTHVGSFALNALSQGAQFARGVDASQLAVDHCIENARLNGFEDRSAWTKANVFEYLPALEADRGRSEGGPFDLIILDPPAFTKSRRNLSEALKGYRQINYRAMKLLPRGGYLATCSCSHFVDEQALAKVIADAAHSASVQLRQVEVRQQAPDHPIVWGIPESSYLKFFIFQVV